MKTTQRIKPYFFQNFLILAFDSQWIEKFNGVPTFIVTIDDENRLHLVSEKVLDLGKRSK